MSDFAEDTNVPANDCISRQAAIDAICSVCGADTECDKSKFVYDAPEEKQVIMCPDHYELTQLPSVETRLNEAELDVLLELLERLEPSVVCEEMSDNEQEWEKCAVNCDYPSPESECFVRYAKMKAR